MIHKHSKFSYQTEKNSTYHSPFTTKGLSIDFTFDPLSTFAIAQILSTCVYSPFFPPIDHFTQALAFRGYFFPGSSWTGFLVEFSVLIR